MLKGQSRARRRRRRKTERFNKFAKFKGQRTRGEDEKERQRRCARQEYKLQSMRLVLDDDADEDKK